MNTDEKIREKAYHLWVEEGRPHGRDQDHWHRTMEMSDGADASAPQTGTRDAVEASRPGKKVGPNKNTKSQKRS